MDTQNGAACCECTPVVGTRFGGEDGRSPSEAVTEAVAAAEGTTLLELSPLYHTVDPDALDRLFEGEAPSTASPAVLQFSYEGWTVVLRDDGALRVCDPDRPTERGSAFEKPIADE